MSNSGVWLKIRLPEGLHAGLRVKAFESRETLGELVVRLLNGSLGHVKESDRVVDVPVTPSSKASRLSVSSVAKVDEIKPPETPKQSSSRGCMLCHKEVTEWVVQNGFNVCLPCAQKHGVGRKP